MERERKVIALPLAPPRRMVPSARFRSFKTQADRSVWQQAWSRVEALQAEGWELEKVVVDFGKALPLLPSQAEAWVREMCAGALAVEWELSGRGRGETRVYLSRAFRGGPLPWVWGDELEPSPLYLELERRRDQAMQDDD